MDGATQHDLLTYYERHFRSGTIDLSESSPPPAMPPTAVSACSLAYQGPDAARELRRAIAARYDTLSEDDVCITNGASEALAAVAMSILRSGDRVFACRGAYPTFMAIANLVGASSRESPDDAGVVLLTNPTIPGGRLVDVAEQIARSEATGARVVVDEVYRELTLNGSRASAACDLGAKAVSIGDLSKPLGLGGLRIGWVASRDREFLRRVRRQSQRLSGGPAAPSLAIAEQAVASFDALVGPLISTARPLASRTYAVLREHGWWFEEPSAGLTVLARPPRPVSAAALQALRDAGWFLVPSEVFGLEGGFRVTLMQPDALAAALEWLAGTGNETSAVPSLIVLTKNPAAGFAKTRLAAAIGSEPAAAFAHAFVRDTLSLAGCGPWRTTVAVPAPGADGWLRAAAPSSRFVEQPPGDLGMRIGAAIAGELEHAPSVVLIASDTPDLPRELIVRAFNELRRADVVVGPARDGGFYLLGAISWRDGLFDDVAWSTGAVCEQLLANVRRLGLRCVVLPEWEDVDDIDSLRRLASRLLLAGTAPATESALRAWQREACLVS